MRSLLIVPAVAGDDLAAALGHGADAVVVDLEETVAAEAKTAGRTAMADFVAAHAARLDRPRLFVRVNGFASGLVDADLDAAIAAGCDGIVLPKAGGGMEITRLDAKIAVAEAVHAVPEGRTRIVAEVAETAQAVLQIATYRGASRRLIGMGWGTADLAADLGTGATHGADGALLDAFRLARTLTLLGAVAAECAPIDASTLPSGDLDRLAAECRAAARDGFTAKFATDPAQIATINAAFTPDAEAIAEATRVVTALTAAGDGEPTTLDGGAARARLARARRVLARAGLD
ncbi:MAG: CoA ester lyase [Phyllobacteriaceae bacterium]|nr:CoA ester lyase [Phyllobacteriaceae bacterium]